MSAVTQQTTEASVPNAPGLAALHRFNWAPLWRRWWPLCLGVVALLGSTAFRFSQSFWQLSDYEHGPLLTLIAFWLLWREREALSVATSPTSAAGAIAWIVPGLFAYLVGVRTKAGFLEFGALVPILAGALWMIGGWQVLRRTWFALLLLFLALPLPANVIMAATAGLKEWVSIASEAILHFAGYPIARDGVTLRVGQYNLLLADACSGMNSLISLTAVGLLYLYLTAQRRIAHLLIMAASILPIAIATNIVRVIVLSLITYYLGDEAGQGFLHEIAGFAIFMIALVLLAAEDAILHRIFGVPAGVRHVGN